MAPASGRRSSHRRRRRRAMPGIWRRQHPDRRSEPDAIGDAYQLLPMASDGDRRDVFGHASTIRQCPATRKCPRDELVNHSGTDGNFQPATAAFRNRTYTNGGVYDSTNTGLSAGRRLYVYFRRNPLARHPASTLWTTMKPTAWTIPNSGLCQFNGSTTATVGHHGPTRQWHLDLEHDRRDAVDQAELRSPILRWVRLRQHVLVKLHQRNSTNTRTSLPTIPQFFSTSTRLSTGWRGPTLYRPPTGRANLRTNRQWWP